MSDSCVTVGIGWLDGSARIERPGPILDVIEGHLGRPREVPAMGANYGASAAFGDSAFVSWEGKRDAQGTVRAEFKQSALDTLGFGGSLVLMADLRGVGYRESRLDEFVDDPERRMTPSRVLEAMLSGDVVTHAKLDMDITGYRRPGQTVYIGAPQSDRRARCYDRENSDGRFELQSRRRMARHAADVLMSAAGDPSGSAALAGVSAAAVALGDNLVSFADFRDRRRSDGKRGPRLDWWQAVVGDMAQARAAPPVPLSPLVVRADHFRRQWAPTLAEFVDELGPGWWEAMLEEGRWRRREAV